MRGAGRAPTRTSRQSRLALTISRRRDMLYGTYPRGY
ncbi:unnamed protein product [Pelagomonas calceolata]|uniref:Uncharacterized protein n=1 Tax=Pelagomonas calceolata TaxID=35677 RepID=A0A8J2SE91_9STRA|nr:unnamed protein product [Pelagomonas calceolata]